MSIYSIRSPRLFPIPLERHVSRASPSAFDSWANRLMGLCKLPQSQNQWRPSRMLRQAWATPKPELRGSRLCLYLKEAVRGHFLVSTPAWTAAGCPQSEQSESLVISPLLPMSESFHQLLDSHHMHINPFLL